MHRHAEKCVLGQKPEAMANNKFTLGMTHFLIVGCLLSVAGLGIALGFKYDDSDVNLKKQMTIALWFLFLGAVILGYGLLSWTGMNPGVNLFGFRVNA